MSDRSLLLQISNHHAARCGTPPRIEERSGQYLGYFENGYGEQMIFVFDRGNGTGWLYAGDAGWEAPYKVVGGVVRELVLSSEEGLWLRACWEAAMAGRRHPGRVRAARLPPAAGGRGSSRGTGAGD